ncbi:hypothetical protein CRYUN_Cryun11dG0153200 [Craigia yunnanensis]
MVSLCLNSLLCNLLHAPKKLSETYLASSSFSNGSIGTALKPIVVSGNPPTFVSAPGRRIVAVGDLHGDLDQARCALESADVLSSDESSVFVLVTEISYAKVLIQLGDVLDRGDDEIAILSLLRSLDIQAKAKGGAVFQVNGNHETMNVEGDFRYVESGAFDECADFLEYLNHYEYEWDEAFRQKGVIARSVLFRPGGPLACELARHAVVLKVNDWIFGHSGLLPHHVAYGIERMNMEVSHWMRGLIDEDSSPHMTFIATKGYDSVVCNRLYSRDVLDLEDYQINQAKTLQAVGAKAMVVGYTSTLGQIASTIAAYGALMWECPVEFSIQNQR